MITRTRVSTAAFVSANWVCLIACLPAISGEADETGSFSACVRVTDKVLNTVKPLVFGDNIEWTNSGMGFWLPEVRANHEIIARPKSLPAKQQCHSVRTPD